ncbi:3'(2'),5'-bisphosphate nucleotidase CysQ [Kaarinaea lacus]
MKHNHEQWLDAVIQIARHAGKKILDIYVTDFDVSHKHDNTPLTEADMAAHNAIVAGLGELDCDFPILSEEAEHIAFSERSQWQTYWLVDPLDGTREFIKKNGEFTVNIALIDDHKPILGVIYAPVTGALYFAAKTFGAYQQKPGKDSLAIHARKKPKDTTVVAGSRSHRGDSLNAFLKKIGKHDILSMGSSLKSCLVAEGKADIYPRLGPTSEWDTAAAQCIVEEAGGKILDLEMKPMRYNIKRSLLNPHFIVIGDPNYDWAQYF